MKARAIAVIAALLSVNAHAEIKAPGYKVQQLVAPSAFRGIHGLAFDANDRLYAGSVFGQTLFRVDTANGKVETIVPPPEGMADDIVFLADGTMVWTSISQNTVRARQGDGPLRVLAEKLASVNSINVRKTDGRLFVGQVFGGDGVWELDPTGAKPPRNILKDLGGFNGFDIGPDGWLYGPLWFKKQIVKINPDTSELKVVADGFHTPAAANFDSKWNLYVLDTAVGTVNHIDIKTGAKKVVAQLDTALDNLAIDSKDRVYVSNMADNGIQEINVATGKARQVIKGRLSSPVSISAAANGKSDTLYVADTFAYRSVDGTTGKVTDLQRSHSATATIAYATAVSASAAHVLVSSSNGTLQKYQRNDGKLLKEWKGLRATGAVELPGGDVLVAQGGSLIRINSKDEKQTIAEGVGRAQSLALSKGGVYFVDGASGQIQHVAFAGAKRTVTAEIKVPQGLAVDSRGQLVTVDFTKQRLVRIDPTSGAITEIATQLPIGARGLERAEWPVSLTIGQAGDIYVTSDIENSIYKISKQ